VKVEYNIEINSSWIVDALSSFVSHDFEVGRKLPCKEAII